MRKMPSLLVTLACVFLFTAAATGARAETLVFHAAQSGKPTLDQGEGGGNPFASSLIELLRQPRMSLGEMTAGLQRLTHAKSSGFQSADVPRNASPLDWSLIPMAAGERRSALVLVVSDYRRSGGAPSLPGAKLDAERIAAALTIVGFSVDVALDLELSAMRTRLAEFARHSAAHDVALIYTTGHGVEVDGAVYLLPGDYPIGERSAALRERALRLETIGAATRAKRVNMVFYGGCRDNPFSP